jgi:hypothetical protein
MRDVRRFSSSLCQYLQPHLGHAQVKQQDVRCFAADHLYSTLGFTLSTNEQHVASFLERHGHLNIQNFVIDHDDRSIASKADWGENEATSCSDFLDRRLGQFWLISTEGDRRAKEPL